MPGPRVLAILGLAAVLTSCQAPPDAAVRKVVIAYMECDECVDGELEAVAAAGDSATTILTTFLAGPPPDRVTRRRQGLLSWQRRVLGDSTPALRATGNRFLENFSIQYQHRAAGALSRINTPAARRALCRAKLGPC